MRDNTTKVLEEAYKQIKENNGTGIVVKPLQDLPTISASKVGMLVRSGDYILVLNEKNFNNLMAEIDPDLLSQSRFFHIEDSSSNV